MTAPTTPGRYIIDLDAADCIDATDGELEISASHNLRPAPDLPPLLSEAIAWMEAHPGERIEWFSTHECAWDEYGTYGVGLNYWQKKLDCYGDFYLHGFRIPPAPPIRPEIQAFIDATNDGCGLTDMEIRAIADAIEAAKKVGA